MFQFTQVLDSVNIPFLWLKFCILFRYCVWLYVWDMSTWVQMSYTRTFPWLSTSWYPCWRRTGRMLGLSTSREQWHHPSASIKWLTLLFEHLINKMYQTDQWPSLIDLFISSWHSSRWALAQNQYIFQFLFGTTFKNLIRTSKFTFHFEDCIYSRLWKLAHRHMAKWVMLNLFTTE